MKKILQKILFILAVRTLRRYTPTIVGITGSVGKTSTKEAVYTVLRWKFLVRKSEGNFNNEIGVPLTILGLPHCGKNIFCWAMGFFRVFFRLIVHDRAYPEILILEMGADHPGDIEYLVRLAPPHIGIITAIVEVPVHVEFYSGPEEIVKEKSKLISALPSDGLAIINADDNRLADIRKNSPLTTDLPTAEKAKVVTFGFRDRVSVRIMAIEFLTEYSRGLHSEIPDGIIVTIQNEGITTRIKLHGTFGKPSAYAVASAFCVGLRFKLTAGEIARALEHYSAPPGRAKLIKGIKGSLILDDTYNSSPSALHEALATLHELPAKRKIAVLGDMLELGKFSEEAHLAAAYEVAEIADMLIAVGSYARLLAEGALSGGIENAKVLPREAVHTFRTSDEAGKFLDPCIREGDLILVKGSQGIRMERVVEEIMAEPEKAAELLVRQSAYWKNKI